MSIEAIRCPGCKDPQTGCLNLVNVAELEAHYRSNHKDGIVKGATTITSANPNADFRPSTQHGAYPPPGPSHAYPSAYPPRPHAFDSPIWGPFLRRYFPHILFGAFSIGVIVGILLW